MLLSDVIIGLIAYAARQMSEASKNAKTAAADVISEVKQEVAKQQRRQQENPLSSVTPRNHSDDV